MGKEVTLKKYSPKMFRNRPIFFTLCVLLIIFGFGLIVLAIWYLKCKTTTLVITDKRSILRYGILSKITNEVRHDDVRNIVANQRFLQRVLGVGSIAISSAGQSGIEISIDGIYRPQKIADLIRENQK